MPTASLILDLDAATSFDSSNSVILFVIVLVVVATAVVADVVASVELPKQTKTRTCGMQGFLCSSTQIASRV